MSIEKALEVIDNEYTEVEAEREAFLAFANRVQSIPATISNTENRVMSGVVTHRTGSDTTVDQRVREAYRQTVVDVPHYDDVYGESVVENFAAEFGTDRAEAVFSGQWTQSIKESLLAGIREAVIYREVFLNALNEEADDLKSVQAELEEMRTELSEIPQETLNEQSFTDLHMTWQRLHTLGKQCDEMAEERQDKITEYAAGHTRRTEGEAFLNYLYSSIDTRHPILSAITTVATDIREQITAIEQHLTRTTRSSHNSNSTTVISPHNS